MDAKMKHVMEQFEDLYVSIDYRTPPASPGFVRLDADKEVVPDTGANTASGILVDDGTSVKEFKFQPQCEKLSHNNTILNKNSNRNENLNENVLNVNQQNVNTLHDDIQINVFSSPNNKALHNGFDFQMKQEIESFITVDQQENEKTRFDIIGTNGLCGQYDITESESDKMYENRCDLFENNIIQHQDSSKHTYGSDIISVGHTSESDSEVSSSASESQCYESDSDDTLARTCTVVSNRSDSTFSDTISIPNSDTSLNFDEMNKYSDFKEIKYKKYSPFGNQLRYFRNKRKNDLFFVKTTATRLGLETRRVSYVQWREENLDDSGRPVLCKLSEGKPKINVGDKKDIFTKERVIKVNLALEWIRKELETMREEDNSLSYKFIQIRQSIQELKLERSCEQHRDMLQEAEWEMQENENLKRVSDIPEFHLQEGLAKYYGLAPIKCGSRKFSLL